MAIYTGYSQFISISANFAEGLEKTDSLTGNFPASLGQDERFRVESTKAHFWHHIPVCSLLPPPQLIRAHFPRPIADKSAREAEGGRVVVDGAGMSDEGGGQ